VDDESSPAAPLRFETRINATPDEIFPYLTESSLFVQWLGTSATLDPVPGGEFALDFENTQARGRYVTVDPPHRVVFTWGVPGDEILPAGSSTVEITLTTDGDGTIVQLLHHDLPAARRDDHAEGWKACLGTLTQVASHARRGR
jgi:uncharacterized protein YndB with AHSA1/START domain